MPIHSSRTFSLLEVIRLAVVLLSLTAATAAQAMSFSLARVGADPSCRRNCVDVIAADGEITNDTAGEFLSFLSENLRDHALRPFVLIESPGGTVLGAMKLGAVFRKIGAGVMVAAARGADGSNGLRLASADCLSACVYAFMGGAKRIVPNSSRLGIHRMVIDEQGNIFGGGGRVYGSPEFVSTLATYARAMGVDPHVIAYAERIPPEAIHILSPGEIRRWHVASIARR